MIQLMLIEDDDNIAFGIETSLTKRGYALSRHSTVAEGKQRFGDDISLVLLDLNLPDGSGYDFCRYLKGIRDVPIIFITVCDDEQAIIKGLDMGADDYIIKPFLLSVLESRIKAVLRRTGACDSTILTCGDIRLDKAGTQVFLQGTELSLTAAEYRLLLALLENKGRTMTRTRLLELLWDSSGSFVNDNTLTVAMKRLREKLQNPAAIKTLRGIGYRMEDLP